jgi:hypothetical protein
MILWDKDKLSWKEIQLLYLPMEIVIAVLQTGLYQNIFVFCLKAWLILLIPILYLFGMMPVSKMFFFHVGTGILYGIFFLSFFI